MEEDGGSNASSGFNMTELCGRQKFVVWDEDINDFGECFQSLVLVCPAHVFLAAVSAYKLGAHCSSGPYYLRTPCQKFVLYARVVAAFILAGMPLLSAILFFALSTPIMQDGGYAEQLEIAIQVSKNIEY